MRYGWSLESATWNALEETIATDRLDWKRQLLDPSHRDFIPQESGVYAVCSKVPWDLPRSSLPPPLYTALYVGKASNLQARFLAHCKSTDPLMKKAVATYGPYVDFWYTRTPLNRISEVESRIIDCLGPPVNKMKGVTITAVIGEPVSI